MLSVKSQHLGLLLTSISQPFTIAGECAGSVRASTGWRAAPPRAGGAAAPAHARGVSVSGARNLGRLLTVQLSKRYFLRTAVFGSGMELRCLVGADLGSSAPRLWPAAFCTCCCTCYGIFAQIPHTAVLADAFASCMCIGQGLTPGAYTRPLFSSTEAHSVGWGCM